MRRMERFSAYLCKNLVPCAIVMVIILCSFAGCNQTDEVTIYIPDTLTIYNSDASVAAIDVQYVFEEGWKEKEVFTVTLEDPDRSEILENSDGTVFNYTNRCVTQPGKIVDITTNYDEKGCIIYRVTEYHQDATMSKLEEIFTYDAYGRRQTYETKSYRNGSDTPTVQLRTYTYQDTEQGSQAQCTANGITETLIYNQQYQLICIRSVVDGQETDTISIEYTYDRHGNLVESVSESGLRSVTTYKAVKVGRETADRLPQFRRES